MSQILQTIKDNIQTARLNHDKDISALLTTLLGELETDSKRTNKPITDEMIIAKVKVFIKNIDILLHSSTNEVSAEVYKKYAIALKEKDILSKYLPSELTKEEIDVIFTLEEFKDIGTAMKYFKSKYMGRYNAKYVSDKFKK